MFFLTAFLVSCGEFLFAQINPYIPHPQPTEFKPIPLGHSHNPSELQYKSLFSRPDPFASEREKRALEQAELQKQLRRQAGIPLPSDLTEAERQQQYIQQLQQQEQYHRQRNLALIYRELHETEKRQTGKTAIAPVVINHYKNASVIFEQGINQNNLSLTKAVFSAEKVQWNNNGEIVFSTFEKQIKNYAEMVREKLPANPQKEDVYRALFRFFRDTTFDRNNKPVHLPFRYDFDDYFGNKNYRKLHVIKLLAENTGQCRSLPLLYKLLATELNVSAWICYAPNHSFIAHPKNSGELVFLELTSMQYVPLSVYLESGFITRKAFSNGIYLDTLSNKKLLASLWVDLASDYWHTIDRFDDSGIVREICQKSLKYYPNNAHAYILLNNICVSRLQRDLARAGNPSDQIIMQSPVWKQRIAEMQDLFNRLLGLGFEGIPKEQYDAWLKKMS